MRMTYTQLLSVAPRCARSSAPVRHHTGEACGTVMATRSEQCGDSCCEGSVRGVWPGHVGQNVRSVAGGRRTASHGTADAWKVLVHGSGRLPGQRWASPATRATRGPRPRIRAGGVRSSFCWNPPPLRRFIRKPYHEARSGVPDLPRTPHTPADSTSQRVIYIFQTMMYGTNVPD